MKFLLFDENAISTYVSESHLQSVEYQEGLTFTKHLSGQLSSEIFHNTKIEYVKDGILFVGRKKNQSEKTDIDKHIFCVDLTTCNLLCEETAPSRLLTVMQRAFRMVLKIWNNYPFSASERISGSKSVLFPFSLTDHHRLVIERSNQVSRLESRGISFPLLAYKYNAEDPGQVADVVHTDILRYAGEAYVDNKYRLQAQIEKELSANKKNDSSAPLEHVEASKSVERSDFIFWNYDQQFKALTESQRKVVECESLTSPLRVDGAAGTGKTVSLIMRAYRLLKMHHDQGSPFRIIFFAHSESTSLRNKDCFSLYPNSEYYLSPSSEQTILFTTLFAFCREFAHIDRSAVIEDNAADSKTYQLMLIDDVVKSALESNRVKTYRPLISDEVYALFDSEKTDRATLINMLQHEFSVQIKGRTDCSIESYIELETSQLKGVDSTIRTTKATAEAGATVVVKEKILTHGKQYAETRFEIELNGEGSSTHLVSRSVAKDNSKQKFISVINGNAKCMGHSECDALIMDNGAVTALPEITANNVEASLIHEAAIGKIAGEQIIKLMTLGLTEKEAEEQIVNGFLK